MLSVDAAPETEISELEITAHRLAGLIRACAMSAARTPGWSRLVLLSRVPFDGEVEKRFSIGCDVARSKEPGELVRVYLDRDNIVPSADEFSRSVLMELRPFIVGVAKIETRETPEGFVVLSCEDGNGILFSHHGSPSSEITPEMIEAGVGVYLDYDPRDCAENDLVLRIFRAMSHARVRKTACQNRGAVAAS